MDPGARPWVELRVHGVSGTPPEELLDRPLVTRVAGDNIAGFYRPRLTDEATDDAPATADEPAIVGPPLEGYVWAGLTSGASSRAFWLLLLPFTLLNVAPRLRPDGPSARSGRVRALWWVTRVLALASTALISVSVAGVGEDLVGWQCGSADRPCTRATPSWLISRIVQRSVEHRLFIGMALPLLLILVLWNVSGRTIRANEAQRVPFVGPPDVDEVEVGLDSTWMWNNEAQVRRLRQIHLQAVPASVLAATAGALVGWLQAVAWIGAAIGIGFGLVALTVPDFTRRGAHVDWAPLTRAVWVVLGVALALVDVWLLFVPHAVATTPVSRGLPGYSALVLGLFLAIVLLTAMLAVTVLLCRTGAARRDRALGGPVPAVAGFGTMVIALLGVFLAAVFSAGVYVFAGAWLSTGSLKPHPSEVAATLQLFAVPEIIRDAALTYAASVGVLILVVVVVGAWAVISLATVSVHRAPIVPGSFEADYGGQPGRTRDRDRQILRVFWFGRAVDNAGSVLAVLVGFGALLTGAAAVMLALGRTFGVAAVGRFADRLAYGSPSSQTSGPPLVVRLQGYGSYLVVITLVLLVGLGALAFRVKATRRSVGILWDLASFWPRSAHPLAAPCYAERTVPDLITRIQWYRGRGTGVVLAGHSQGTVISMATLLQLGRLVDGPAAVPADVAYLSFGCVLRRLYARFFPVYFGPPALRDLDARLTIGPVRRWRNLWRYSDYLGGAVMAGPPAPVPPGTYGAPEPGRTPADAGPDLHLIDPTYAIAPGDTVYPAAGRHSTFWTSREFQAAVVDLGKLVQ